jgi:hypothetical protein
MTQQRFVTDWGETDDGIAIAQRELYPDVAVASAGRRVTRAPQRGRSPLPVRVRTAMPSRVPQSSIEIRDVKGRSLVAAIELLSPVNKRGRSRHEYIDRRNKILASTAHLIEIDLLRAGQRVPMAEPLPKATYYAIITRADHRPDSDVYPIQLDQPLPSIPIPLRERDPQVQLELQDAFTSVYDQFLDLLVDYADAPDVPLSAQQSAWATRRLRAAGRRK